MSAEALRRKQGEEVYLQKPTWAINLCHLKAMFSLLPLSVPVHGAKEWGDEVGFVLLCFHLILRLIESAQYW